MFNSTRKKNRHHASCADHHPHKVDQPPIGQLHRWRDSIQGNTAPGPVYSHGHNVATVCQVRCQATFFCCASSVKKPKAWGNSSLIPNSTSNATLLKAAIVSPIGWRTRGCHPSGIRSSKRNGRRSFTLPPKMVNIVEELISKSSEGNISRMFTKLTWSFRRTSGRW